MNISTRVLGWDLLRGQCAFVVAAYHLFLWTDIAALHAFGSYGVYLFFILSGASLSYTYFDRISMHTFSFAEFLWARYLRLAPLYILLMLLVLPWKLLKEAASGNLVTDYLLNASLLFGFYKPTTHSVLIGGWSLGIEVIFYLFFPLLLASFRRRAVVWAVFIGLAVLQIAWINITLGQPGGYASGAVAYHNAPAFVAYFMGGCMLGVARHQAGAQTPGPKNRVGIMVLLAGFLIILLVNPEQQGTELTGWLGLFLSILCFAMVYWSGKLDLTGRTANVAKLFGDATYGVYLLHPILFFGLLFVVFPRLGMLSVATWPWPARLALVLSIVLAAVWLALKSEKYIEAPLRRRWKR